MIFVSSSLSLVLCVEEIEVNFVGLLELSEKVGERERDGVYVVRGPGRGAQQRPVARLDEEAIAAGGLSIVAMRYASNVRVPTGATVAWVPLAIADKVIVEPQPPTVPPSGLPQILPQLIGAVVEAPRVRFVVQSGNQLLMTTNLSRRGSAG